MGLDPEALWDKPAATVARWAYYAREQAGYEDYMAKQATWAARNASGVN